MDVLRGRSPDDGGPLTITIADGVVQAIEPGEHEEQAWVVPGFIDLQVNGYGGSDLNVDTPDPGEIIALAAKVAATGVTTFIPTVITASEEKILTVLRSVAVARRSNALVAAMVPYVHVEGPNISAVDGPRGAHPAGHVRPPSDREFARWQEASDGLVGMVTLSPHFAGVEEYIARLTAWGVHVAIGHTDATPEQIHRAVDAGARLSTHLGNGIAATIPRHPNVVWTQLAEDRMTATFIADGHHLPGDTLKAMIRAKGVERSILVSDAVALAGMPAGMYETAIGGRVELREDGRLGLAGTPFLAGAAVALKECVARAVSLAGCSLADAVTMATRNPGRFVGGRGFLQVGQRADIVRFTLDEDQRSARIHTVLVSGQEWPEIQAAMELSG